MASPVAESSHSEVPAFDRTLPWLLLIGGIIGCAAAFVLTVEKMRLLADPTYVPSCSLNPVLSCGSVMLKPQAEVFGFSNSLIGVGGFAAVATIGAAILAGAQFRRWFWLGLQAGALFGICFVSWLMFQSLYRINALCPYCMAVWAVMVPLFVYITLYNLDRRNLPVPGAFRSLAAFLVRNHTVVLTVWVLTVTALVVERFWDYWTSIV